MSKDKKVTAQVVEHVKKLANGDIVTLFAEKNSFKDPETGAPLSLSEETLHAISKGDYDHLLKTEEKKSEEKKGLKEKLQEKLEQNSVKEEETALEIRTEDASAVKTTEVIEEKQEEKPKKIESKKIKNANLEEIKKRGVIALCILIPILGLSIYYQEKILETISEVAKSFAVVSAVIAAIFVIPLAMDPSLKKGFRVVGLLFVAIGFYLIYLGGAFFNGLLALAVGAMIFMLTV